MELLQSKPRRRAHSMAFGAQLCPGGAVRFRVWAPSHERVEVALVGHPQSLPTQRLEAGWHELTTDSAKAGTRYKFVPPDGSRVPDPASRFQPEDVHGAS